MSMRSLFVSVALVGSFVTFVPEARALDAACMSKLGDCSVTNSPQDFTSCECVGGEGIAGGGGNEWAGLNQAQLQAVCEEQLDQFCGPPGPIEGVPCESELGMCIVDNEPDSVSCDCVGEGGGGAAGGNEWDGFTDEQLAGVCAEQLEVWCGDQPDPEWLCENDLGGCSITTDEDVSVFCGCAFGGGGGGPGDPEWVDLGEDELLEVCFMQLDNYCGAIDPSDSDSDTDTTDSASESDTNSGSDTTDSSTDTTDSDPTDSGPTGTEGGSDDTTGNETTGDPDPTTGEESSSGASATMTGVDTDSATMTDASASASNTAGSEESSSGGDGGATGEPSGCSCSAANDEPPLGFALGLVGLVGMRLRRRWRR
jgi:MYXO-CTERM domain-containing protein